MTSGIQPPRRSPQLPIWGCFKQSYRSFILDHPRCFLAAALVPLVLSTILGVTAVLLHMEASTAIYAATNATDSAGRTVWYGPHPLARAIGYGLNLVSFIPAVVFAIAWHRLILLGPVRAAPALVPSWQHRHWRYLGYAAGLGILVATVFLALDVNFTPTSVRRPPDALMLPEGQRTAGVLVPTMNEMALFMAKAQALLIIGVIALRLGFLFPAVAIDLRYGLRNAWHDMREQGLRILASAILVSVPAFVVYVAVVQAASRLSTLTLRKAGFGLNDFVVLLAVDQMLTAVGLYLILAAFVSMISLAFQWCSGWGPPGSGIAAPGPASRASGS